MAKNEKIKAKNILAAIDKKSDTTIITVGEAEKKYNIVVKNYLDIRERRDFVNAVSGFMFSQSDDGSVGFYPYLRKFAVEYNIIDYFTNIELPDDAEAAWNFLSSTNIVEKVCEAIPEEYLQDLLFETKEAIEYNKKMLLNKGKFDELVEGAINLIQSLTDKINSADGQDIIKFIEESLPELKDEFSKVFQETSFEEMSK